MKKNFYDIKDVQEATGMSRSFAYKLVNRLNAELQEQGRIIIPGHVDAAYFNERLFGKKAVA